MTKQSEKRTHKERGAIGHADLIAAINLARRARGVWHPEMPDKKATLNIQSEGEHKTA